MIDLSREGETHVQFAEWYSQACYIRGHREGFFFRLFCDWELPRLSNTLDISYRTQHRSCGCGVTAVRLLRPARLHASCAVEDERSSLVWSGSLEAASRVLLRSTTLLIVALAHRLLAPSQLVQLILAG